MSIKIAIAGVGNCASSLLQGIEHYRRVPREAHEAWGLLHLELGGYRPEDVEVVAAFDVDRRKVGRALHEAAFAPPNCTRVIADEIAKSEVVVRMGPVLDGVAPHMREYPEARSFRVADEEVSAAVRVRHLLTHTAGWFGDDFTDPGDGDDALAEYVAAMASLPQIAPLGDYFSYNNAAFSVAGRVIEVVTG